MTTLIPREPYSREELDGLYPKALQLQLVQIVSSKYAPNFAIVIVAFLSALPIFIVKLDNSQESDSGGPSQLLRHGKLCSVDTQKLLESESHF